MEIFFVEVREYYTYSGRVRPVDHEYVSDRAAMFVRRIVERPALL